jgi:hypothetical protein
MYVIGVAGLRERCVASCEYVKDILRPCEGSGKV